MSVEAELIERLAAEHPTEAAQLLEGLSVRAAREIIASLSTPVRLELLHNVSPAFAADCLLGADAKGGAGTLGALEPETAAAILRATPRKTRREALSDLPPDSRSAISRVLRFDPDTAAALMEPGTLAVAGSLSVAEALARIRTEVVATMTYVYVLDPARTLVGVASVAELVRATPEQSLSTIAHSPVITIQATDTWETAMRHAGWERFHMLPVVDREQRFLGAIRLSAVRAAERRFVPERSVPWSKTGGSLAELYGVGLRGLLGLTVAAFEPRGSRRDSGDPGP